MSAPATVAVLAGGSGERIGGAKPCVSLAGQPLISYPLRAAAAAGLRAVVIAKPDSPLPDLEVRIVHELSQPRHPLCGLVAALEHAPAGTAVLAVACDLPFLTTELLAWFAALPGAAVASSIAGLQPSLCRLAQAHLPALRASLKRSLPLRAALVALQPRVVGEGELERFGQPERLLFNVNSHAELALAEEWLAQDSRASRAAASRS